MISLVARGNCFQNSINCFLIERQISFSLKVQLNEWMSKPLNKISKQILGFMKNGLLVFNSWYFPSLISALNTRKLVARLIRLNRNKIAPCCILSSLRGILPLSLSLSLRWIWILDLSRAWQTNLEYLGSMESKFNLIFPVCQKTVPCSHLFYEDN